MMSAQSADGRLAIILPDALYHLSSVGTRAVFRASVDFWFLAQGQPLCSAINLHISALLTTLHQSELLEKT